MLYETSQHHASDAYILLIQTYFRTVLVYVMFFLRTLLFNVCCKKRKEQKDDRNKRIIGPKNAHLKPDLEAFNHHEMTLNTHTPLLTA